MTDCVQWKFEVRDQKFEIIPFFLKFVPHQVQIFRKNDCIRLFEHVWREQH